MFGNTRSSGEPRGGLRALGPGRLQGLRTAVLPVLLVSGAAWSADVAWTKLDLDQNQRFDRADIAKVLAAGPDLPTLDVNGDGTKNRKDTVALYVTLWRLDRTADLAVTAEDFVKPAPVTLTPATDDEVGRLARRLVADLQPKLPPQQESRLQLAWKQANVAEPLAAMYDRAGPAALLAKNLDVATWAYAKSLSLDPRRVSALNGLGFVLLERGRDQDAAGVLARAAELGPRVCAVQANLGFLAARNGLLPQAERAFTAAITACPTIGQYRLNRALLRVRLGRPHEAVVDDAREAVTSSPGDLEAAAMLDVLDPGSAPSIEEARREYERRRAELNADPWNTLRPCEQAQALLDSIDAEYGKKWEATKDRITRETDVRMKRVADTVMPEGASYCADIKKWSTGAGPAVRSCANVRRMAESEAGQQQARLNREWNRRKVAAIPLIFQLATQQAKADAKAATALDPQLRGLGARVENAAALASEASAETMRHCYTEPVATIAAEGKAISSNPVQLDLYSWESAIVQVGPFLVMPAATMKYGYASNECEVKPPALNIDLAAKWTLSLVLVQLEYDFVSHEVRLQVGQGLIVAGSWSPERGFGFEAGVGFDLDVGPSKAVSVSAVEYWKFGSDGSVVQESEFGAGLDFGGSEGLGVEVSSSETLLPAQHAPVGAW